MLHTRTVLRNIYRELKRDLKTEDLPYDTLDILDAMNQAMKYICIRSKSLRGSTSFTAPSSSPTEGDTAAYTGLPTDFIEAYGVQYKDSSDNVSPMGIISVEVLDQVKTGWRNFEPITTAVQYVFIEQGMFGTYPEMDTDNEGTVYVHYYKTSRKFQIDEGVGQQASGQLAVFEDTTRNWGTNDFKNGLLWTREQIGEVKQTISSNTSTTAICSTTITDVANTAYIIESASELNDSYEEALYSYAKYKLTGDRNYLGEFEHGLGIGKMSTLKRMSMRP